MDSDIRYQNNSCSRPYLLGSDYKTPFLTILQLPGQCGKPDGLRAMPHEKSLLPV